MLTLLKNTPIYIITKRHLPSNTEALIPKPKPRRHLIQPDDISSDVQEAPQSQEADFTPIIPQPNIQYNPAVSSSSTTTLTTSFSNNPEIIPDQPDVLLPQNGIIEKKSWTQSFHKFFEKLPLEKQKEFQEQHDKIMSDQGNQTYNDIVNGHKPLFVPTDISKEALFTDLAFKSFTTQIDTVTDKLNIQMEKSAELAEDWNTHIFALDKYIKSLKGLPWRKTLTYSACFLLVISAIYKIGALRAIPQFAGYIGSLILSPSNAVDLKNTATSVPKPDVAKTMQTLLETPVTPVGLVIGVGTLTVGYGVLYTLAILLKKMPK